jgi:hypothetical protein
MYSQCFYPLEQHLSNRADGPDADVVVGVTTEQGGTVSRPAQASAEWSQGLATAFFQFWVQFSNNLLGFQVPDGDVLVGGSANQ